MPVRSWIKNLISRGVRSPQLFRHRFRQHFRGLFWRRLRQGRRYILTGGYILFVGFALGGILLILSRPPADQDTPPAAPTARHSVIYEEGHSEVEALVNLPPSPLMPPSLRPSAPVQNAPAELSPPEPVWERNAVRPVGLAAGQPAIAIVIDDLGIRKRNTRRMINLSPGLTLAFLPYATQVQTQTALARQRGHELMIHMPMQPKGAASPGPQALERGLSREELLARLDYNLSRFDGYVGINNHMGSAFTEDGEAVAAVIENLKNKGLLVLDSRTTSASRLAELSARQGVPHASRDVFLDNRQDVTYILGQLDKLEGYARRRGMAVGIGHPYGETINALERWLPTLKQKGIALVPLSQVVREKTRRNLLVQNRADILAE